MTRTREDAGVASASNIEHITDERERVFRGRKEKVRTTATLASRKQAPTSSNRGGFRRRAREKRKRNGIGVLGFHGKQGRKYGLELLGFYGREKGFEGVWVWISQTKLTRGRLG